LNAGIWCISLNYFFSFISHKTPHFTTLADGSNVLTLADGPNKNSAGQVFTIKVIPEGMADGLKTHLVAKGCTQNFSN